MSMKASNMMYVLSDALRSIRANLITTIFTSLTLGFSLAIFALFLFVFINANAAIKSFGDRTRIIAYVKDNQAVDPEVLRKELLKIPGVGSAEYVSKDRALKELKDELKGHESILEGVDANPLPASFEIKLSDSFRDPSLISSAAQRLKALNWVEDIQWNREWVEKFSAFLRFIELAALIIGVFLGAATIFIISNTIRLTVYARKDEIEIMRLVGASTLFVKVPFFMEGALQGFLGGVLALLMLWAGQYLLLSNVPAYFRFVADVPFPAYVVFGFLVAAGVVMGVAGSLISMGKFLKV